MRALLCCCLTLSAFSSQAEPLDEVLTDPQWEQVNESVDRALEWLSRHQNPDGSFPTLPHGQPGVTGLCVMAFLAQGHLPGEGRYGNQLQNALDFMVSCQKRNGLLAFVAPNGKQISRDIPHRTGISVSYNHAIAGLVLSESYAMVRAEKTKVIQPVIEKALQATSLMQDWPKEQVADKGGWRYLDDYEYIDADLSVTGWQLMFLRSAKNAGFDVQQKRIERAIGYVRRCFRQDLGTFTYKIEPYNRFSRGMAGAGILALAHSGLHHTPEAQSAGDWILKSGFHRYNTQGRVAGFKAREDRYHYGLMVCSQAMYQLGGRHWREFFPLASKVLMSGQNPDGSWESGNRQPDGTYGKAYTTATGVLALSASNQLLPIFQR